MKTLKQITLLCLFWMIGMSALAYDFAVENADGVTIYYNITSSTSPQTVAVTNDGDTEFSVYTAETINIPNTVTYNGNTYGVTGIGEEAFYNATTVKSITLPKYLTSIGIYAFYGCSSLASITIPNSVTSIGSYAFYGCSSLASITIPNSVTRIGVYAFKYCSSLPVIDNIRYADTYLVEAVDKSMNEYSIKDGTKWIGDYAFYDCRNLISITIPDSVTSIGTAAFSQCSSLASITIPNSVTIIGAYAFMYCSNLTSVTLPNSLTTIDNQAFCYTGLKQLSIPASVTNIGCSAFAYTSLEEVRIEDGDEFLSMCGSYYWSNSLTNGATFYQTRGIKKLYIGRNISSDCFARGGFNGSASSIESFEIGAKGHYDERLESMNNLKYIRCYGGLKSIAKGLKNKLVCVPKGLKNEYLKMSCWQGNTIVEEGEVVQDICGDSISWTLNVDEEMLTISGNGQIAPSMFSSRFPWHKYTYIIKNIIIEDSINSIRGSESYEYSNLASVTLSNSVTSIGGYAFSQCSGLTSITIPNSVTSIGTAAFSQCSGLTSITIPNSVTSIGTAAFSQCSSLASITIPNSVTSIGDYAFYYCNYEV